MNVEQWNSGRLLEMSGSYWKTCTLHASIKIDVFTVLGDEQFGSKDIAQRLNVDERGISTLLNALVAMNLLLKIDDKYSNTSVSRLYLSKGSPEYLGYIMMHHHHLMDSWSQLVQAVKSGKSVKARAAFSQEEMRESFIMGMFNLAMGIAPRLATEINLSNRRHLLDLGGGPGTYAIHFCLKNPQLKATIFDLPTTRPFAEKTVKRFNLTERIDFIGGNYLKDEIDGSYDAALLSHILHAEGFEESQNIMQKTVKALNPGGIVIVHDFILNDTMDGPLFPALFSLNMLLATAHGQSYSGKQIMKIMADSGLKEIKRIPFQGPNDSGVITGIVQ